MDYDRALDQAIEKLHEEGRYRVFIDIEREKGNFPHAVWTKPDGSKQDITIWCGNDYLGMGQHPVVLAAMHEALDATGAGSGGTRNISGTTVYHKRLEHEIADLHGKEAALVFSSAYIANDATLSTLPKLFPGLIIYSDELNHASMIEGIRRNGGAKRIFRHNDVAHLRELLAADDPAAPKLIAFESVYSMDGDFGPIEDERAQAVLRAAREGGINFYDTADVYGDGRSERFVGAHLKPGELVATKVGRSPDLYPDGYTQQCVRDHVLSSVERLGGEQLDLIQLGAMGSGPRRLLQGGPQPQQTFAVLEIDRQENSLTETNYVVSTGQPQPWGSTPKSLVTSRGRLQRNLPTRPLKP